MITILEVKEIQPDLSTPKLLHVAISIDGYNWELTFAADTSKQQIIDYINANKSDILRWAKARIAKHSLEPVIRQDLMDIKLPSTEFKASTLYGLTQSQLETYIDNNVTNIATARTYLKKLSAVVLYLVKHTELDK
jgi:hypothetical protein